MVGWRMQYCAAARTSGMEKSCEGESKSRTFDRPHTHDRPDDSLSAPTALVRDLRCALTPIMLARLSAAPRA